jgi:hypothetical protein
MPAFGAIGETALGEVPATIGEQIDSGRLIATFT